MSMKFESNDDPLSSLLRASRPAPPLPPRFEEAVWRRLARAENHTLAGQSTLAWLERWVERLLLPRFAVASLSLLLAAGVLTGVLTNTGATKQQALERYLSAVAPNSLH